MKRVSVLLASLTGIIFLKAQNVGIGTNIPTYPLTVMSDGSNKGIVQKAGTAELGFYVSTAGGAYVQTWSPTDLYFTTNNGNAKIAIANTTGYVGIATTTPSAQLDINGTLRIRGNGAAAGAVLTSDANGNATWQIPGGSQIYSVGSVDFTPATSSSPAVSVYGGSGGAYYGGAYYGNLVAPVHLPDGAKVNKIVVWYLDNEAENLTLTFGGEVTTTNYSGGYQSFATLYSNGAVSNSFRTVTQTYSTPITIDNESYNYQFSAFVHWSGSFDSFAIKAVKFYYTY